MSFVHTFFMKYAVFVGLSKDIMGVYGLWRLLDSTGKQVPLETLEGKVLAIGNCLCLSSYIYGCINIRFD